MCHAFKVFQPAFSKERDGIGEYRVVRKAVSAVLPCRVFGDIKYILPSKTKQLVSKCF